MLYLLKVMKCFPSLLRLNVAATALLIFACLLHSFTGLQKVSAARGVRTRGRNLTLAHRTFIKIEAGITTKGMEFI